MPPVFFESRVMEDKTVEELQTIIFDASTELSKRSKQSKKAFHVQFPHGQIRKIADLKKRWPYLPDQVCHTLACNIQLCDVNRWQLNTWKIGLTAGTMWEWQCTLPVISTIETLLHSYCQLHLKYSPDTNFKKLINKAHSDEVITLKLRDELHELREFRNEIHLYLKGKIGLHDNLPKHYNDACRALVEMESQVHVHWKPET